MAKLSPKHWKALELFEEGTLSLKEIAKACHINQDVFYDLVEGDTSSQGETATLFKSEIDKITTRSAAKIRVLVKDNKKLALQKMNDFLREVQTKKLTSPILKQVVSCANSLSKLTPSVSIGSISYTKGFTAEDLTYEFNRLSTLARNALESSGIPSIAKKRERGISRIAESGDTVSED